ncbi:hypothetical protein TrLO_g5936 [Triparma laevis f. longispina]|uniref:Protein kinase domain-containing protein n=1 Tax=Triparma laevis f. longispina TaxID=1714387 RepID=A0A9W6ZS04_9STRA|nr:hypothetical protein TrLO_g5936 [Triparma laevis f. longispina]
MASFLRRLFKKKKNTEEDPPLPVRRQTQTFHLQDFEVLQTIGNGTFGRVRLAKLFGENNECYALKAMKKTEIIRLKQFKHVLSEINVMSVINHPFIVDMIGHFQDESRVYIVLEYVQGGELFTLLRKEGAFSLQAVIFYTSEILLSLSYLHQLKIVYRDLKPENVLLTPEGHIKLIDFGLSKFISDRTWTLCGTAEYLSPEIIENIGHGLSVDWWALGVLIYEMLAGHPPFWGETAYETYRKIISGKFIFESTFDPNSRDIVTRLLTKDRRKRLGCGKLSHKEIMNHEFLKGVDFDAVLKMQAQVPYLMEKKGIDGTGNFQSYPDSYEDDAIPLNGEDREKFREFVNF